MKDFTCNYWNVETDYSAKRTYRVDVASQLTVEKGKVTKTVIVYKKEVPLSLVLGLRKQYAGFPELAPYIHGLGCMYQYKDGELLHVDAGEGADYTEEPR